MRPAAYLTSLRSSRRKLIASSIAKITWLFKVKFLRITHTVDVIAVQAKVITITDITNASTTRRIITRIIQQGLWTVQSFWWKYKPSQKWTQERW